LNRLGLYCALFVGWMTEVNDYPKTLILSRVSLFEIDSRGGFLFLQGTFVESAHRDPFAIDFRSIEFSSQPQCFIFLLPNAAGLNFPFPSGPPPWKNLCNRSLNQGGRGRLQ
jgi:hypothetical protein